jgi:hypothetical protein
MSDRAIRLLIHISYQLSSFDCPDDLNSRLTFACYTLGKVDNV